MLEFLSDAYLSAAATLVIAGPAEWAVHKHILHSRSRSVGFIKEASVAHNDNHHGAFMSPQHYYRDITNEDVTVHFSKGDVALIAASGAAIGAGVSSITDLSTFAAAAGSTAGALVAYGSYEFFHHYMHVIGERRLQIGRVFGDFVEGERSGNLRLPKPVLDDLGNTVEDRLEGRESRFGFSQIAYDLLEDRGLEVDIDHAIDYTEQSLRSWEESHRESLTPKQRKAYSREKRINRSLRRSRIFGFLDNHHFVHHRSYGNNLNVVWAWFDKLIGTKKPSDASTLISNQKYWLCPNSPDEEKFVLKE